MSSRARPQVKLQLSYLQHFQNPPQESSESRQWYVTIARAQLGPLRVRYLQRDLPQERETVHTQVSCPFPRMSIFQNVPFPKCPYFSPFPNMSICQYISIPKCQFRRISLYQDVPFPKCTFPRMSHLLECPVPECPSSKMPHYQNIFFPKLSFVRIN